MRIAEKDSSHDNEKHGNLSGGVLSREVLDSSPAILRRTHNGGAGDDAKLVGLQQYFTPIEIARFAARVIGPSTPTLDFTAGTGSMLQVFNESHRFGVEIDGEHARAAHESGAYLSLHADAQKAVPMMRAVDMKFGGIAINPPFGLTWQDRIHSKTEGAQIPSVKLAFLWALDLMDHTGNGIMLCDQDDLKKNVLPTNQARGIYAIIDIEGPIWQNVTTPCSLVLFVQPENLSWKHKDAQHTTYLRRFTAPKDHLLPLVDDVVRQRTYAADYVYSRGTHEWGLRPLVDQFKGLREEYNRRRTLQEKGRAHITHDLDLNKGKVRVYLNSYARERLARAGNLRQLELLNGQSVNYFATNTRDWKVADDAEKRDLITVSDPLKARVQAVMTDAIRTSTPLFPIPEQMRLGWIEDLTAIRCRRDDPARGFRAGEHYRIFTQYKIHKEHDERVKTLKTGEMEPREYVQERKLLHVIIKNDSDENQDFDESGVNIRYLMEYFDLPDPGDVKTKYPDLVARNIEVLEEIEAEVKENFAAYAKTPPNNVRMKDVEAFAYKHFQKDHMSRLLTKLRGLLAHEQGLGKTLQLLTLGEATIRISGCENKVLVVVPQDLIPQWQNECQKFLGRKLEVIRTPAEAHAVSRRLLGEKNPDGTWKREPEDGWFITHYEALSRVGRVYEALPEEPLLPTIRLQRDKALLRRAKKVVDRHHRMTGTTVGEADKRKIVRARMEELRTRGLNSGPYSGESISSVRNHHGMDAGHVSNDTRPATTKWACPKCLTDTAHGWTGEVCRKDRTKGHFGCGYVHRKKRFKSGYAHLGKCFIDGVVLVDELSEMRGDTSQRSLAIRALARGKHKYGGTGTPLSNYINDTYWGLWFALGDASLAFPYAYRGGRAKFEEDFCVIEHLLGKKGTKKEGQREQKKILARVTNISQFWRLTQPSVSRCRKEHTGEPIVERIVHPVIVPMGRTQKAIHEFALMKFADWFKYQYPDHALVAHDLVDKFEAGLGQRWWLEKAATLPEDLEQLRSWPELERLWEASDFIDGVSGADKVGEEVYPWRHDVSNWTPANLKTLQIAIEHAEKGDKVLIGSDLIGTGHWISARLNEKGLRSVHITDEAADGSIKTQSPAKRAKAIQEFTNGDAQVMCAGVKAVKLGHNMDQAQVVIVHGLPDSYMEIDQFIARVHRLTSTKPVTVYVILPKGSLADTKWSLLKDKGGTSDLAFDGELAATNEEEIDWAKVLKDLKETGVTFDGSEVHEADVAAAWDNVTYTAPTVEKPLKRTLIDRPTAPYKVELADVDKNGNSAPEVTHVETEKVKPLPTRRTKITKTEVLSVEEHLEERAKRMGLKPKPTKRSPVRDRASVSMFDFDEDGSVKYEQDSLFG